jgi:glycosyltransferase involved in cell wall biosynthesis
VKLSLIATTYNQPVELDLFLRSLARQTTDEDFEVLIADDGSRKETREVVERHRHRHGPRLKHIWHEDLGYRKSKIVNQAVRESRGDWLVFTDADTILHPRFLEDHAAQRAPRRLFMGRRVDLNDSSSRWIRANPESLFSNAFYACVVLSARGAQPSRNVNRAWRVDCALARKLARYDEVPDLLGSNFSIDRKLFIEVNGFDEGLQHYWGEDGDLFIRCRNAKADIVGKKAYAVQFHLWHPQRAPQPDAESQYQRRLKEDFQSTWCQSGLAAGRSIDS